MSAIKNLMKAHKAQAISKDTHSLKTYLATEGVKGTARMEIVAVETKYVAKFDQNSPQWNGQAQGNGHRTRFTLSNGETVGTFSQAGHAFFTFFANLMGHSEIRDFLHIDISGVLQVDLSTIELDGQRSTYDFTIHEEGSVLNGFSEYIPNAAEILGITNNVSLEAPKQVEALPEPEETKVEEATQEVKETKTTKGAK